MFYTSRHNTVTSFRINKVDTFVLDSKVMNRDVGCFGMLYLVQDIVRTRILHLYHNVGMQEV